MHSTTSEDRLPRNPYLAPQAGTDGAKKTVTLFQSRVRMGLSLMMCCVASYFAAVTVSWFSTWLSGRPAFSSYRFMLTSLLAGCSVSAVFCLYGVVADKRLLGMGAAAICAAMFAMFVALLN